MNMNLLGTDSPTYKRRLIREINSRLRSGKPVYVTDYPFNQRIKRVVYSPNTNSIIYTLMDGKLESIGQQFTDGVQEIVASRESA